MPTCPEPDRTVETIVIRASRANLAGLCAYHLFVLWIGGRLWEVVVNWFPSLMALAIVKAIGLLFAGGIVLGYGIPFVCHLSRLIFNCPLLVLTPEGIQNGSYGCVFPFLRWQTIKKISLCPFSTRLRVFVHVPETEYKDSRIARFVAGWLTVGEQSAAVITVCCSVLPGWADALFEQIKAYCADQHVGEQIQFVREQVDDLTQ